MTQNPENAVRSGSIEKAFQPNESDTKIHQIREQLKANPAVFFAGEIHAYYPSAPDYGYFSEGIDILVAPMNPLFSASELNAFMNALIKNLAYTSVDQASETNQGDLRLGKLYFDEQIGEQREITFTTIITNEPETLAKAGKEVGTVQRESVKKLLRRTWVRVYPDRASAQAMVEYEQGRANNTVDYDENHDSARFNLSRTQLDRLKENAKTDPLAKIRGFFSK